jgi:hypothetical protein
MKVKGVVEEDFVNYRLPSMYIVFPTCSFKCDKENGNRICQNSALVREKDIEVSCGRLVQRYMDNPISRAIVMAGLEPFDSFDDLFDLIEEFRKVTNDDIVIYTGYKEEEINEMVAAVTVYPNIIIKFGRFIPNDEGYFNEELGVHLASKNQYTVRYHNDKN